MNVKHKSWITGLATVVLAFVTLGSWGLSSSIGSSPDEDYHLVSIWCAQGERDKLCSYGNSPGEVLAPEALVIAANCFAFNPQNSGACNLPGAEKFLATKRNNSDGAYPPIFYQTMSIFASTNIESSVLLMRFFNAFLFVFLVTITILSSPRKIRLPMIGGILVTSVPLGVFLIPSLNPSSWAIMSATILWPSIVGYIHSTSKMKKGLLLSITYIGTLIGSGARGDAAIYSLIALVVACLLSWTAIKGNPKILLPVLGIVPLALFLFSTSGQAGVTKPISIGTSPDFGLFVSNLVALPSLWIGSLGGWGLGWLDTQMPPLVTVSTVFAFSGAIFFGLSRWKRGKNTSLLLLASSITALPMYVLTNEGISVGVGVQPRYLYPILIMIAGVALWGVSRNNHGLKLSQIVVLASCLTIANSVALHVNIRRYISGVDVQGLNLDGYVEWWWSGAPTPMFIWILGSMSFFGALILLLNWAVDEKNPKRRDFSAG